jgi:hypothetical protein
MAERKNTATMTPILSAIGATAAGAPLVLINTQDLGGGIIWTGSIIASLVAIGVGVGKVWQLARAASARLDQLDHLDIKLDEISKRLETAGL